MARWCPRHSADNCTDMCIICVEYYQRRIEHHFNGLHVYCYLNKFLPRPLALKLSGKWEKIAHPLIYGKPKPAVEVVQTSTSASASE